MFDTILDIIRERYGREDFIPLHVPVFRGREKEYLAETIDSTFVSSVGEFVNRFEEKMAGIAGTRYAVATVNGTSALHTALRCAGVGEGDEVLTQALSFIATANAVRYLRAEPVILDIDRETLGLSPEALEEFLESRLRLEEDGTPRNRETGRRVAACVPMHTFGHPCRIDAVAALCGKWNIPVIEDAAESLGSRYRGQHTGSFGRMGVFSFNGNKIVTCGGGGAIVTDDEELARRAKHLTTQAKVDHPWRYRHDEVGYNYRLPNVNAALACAQLEQLDEFVSNKRETAGYYGEAFRGAGVSFQHEPADARSNYWLNAIRFESRGERDEFLNYSNDQGVMTRPAWELIPDQPPYRGTTSGDLSAAREAAGSLVNIPSSYLNKTA